MARVRPMARVILQSTHGRRRKESGTPELLQRSLGLPMWAAGGGSDFQFKEARMVTIAIFVGIAVLLAAILGQSAARSRRRQEI